MPRIRHIGEQIIGKLRQAEVETTKGGSVAAACKAIGVAEETAADYTIDRISFQARSWNPKVRSSRLGTKVIWACTWKEKQRA